MPPPDPETLMLIGVKMLVGVKPVLPSIKESKFRQAVGVSMLTPSILLNGIDLSDKETGRWGFKFISTGEFMGKFSNPSEPKTSSQLKLESISGSDLTTTFGPEKVGGLRTTPMLL